MSKNLLMISAKSTPNSSIPFYTALYEVLGNTGESCIGNKTQDVGQSYLTELCDYLSKQFSPVCACGLAQQIGRSAFVHTVRETDGMGELTAQSFRLLPTKLRLRHGLEQLKALIEIVFGITVELVDTKDGIQLITNDQDTRHDLIPHLETGFIQEFVLWVSGGKPHSVSIQSGEPGWRVLIGKQPLDP